MNGGALGVGPAKVVSCILLSQVENRALGEEKKRLSNTKITV